ncbi:MAG: chorismate synthase [Actinobacteria bacterium]|nr:chorismate synthase [Actinomycetota bacterium]
MNFKTAGESHGKGLVGIISDFPSGIHIDPVFIDSQLLRRQKGYGRGERMAIEKDRVEIISGIRNGKTTGSPISFIIKNRDWENWQDLMRVFPDTGKTGKEEKLLTPRPGHADLTGLIKYRLETIRDVIERSSARETAARVCVGSFAKTALEIIGIKIFSYVRSIGKVDFDKYVNIRDERVLKDIEESEVRCPGRSAAKKMMEAIDLAKRSGNSIGGSFKVIITGTPPGLGSFTEWDKRLDARLAYAIMAIPAIKAFEVGNGSGSGAISGLDFHDEIFYGKDKGFFRKTNRAGGIEGGMSNGEDIVIGAVMKPIPTTTRGIRTVDIKNKIEAVSLKERSDVCAVPSAAIVAESAVSIEILKAVQKKFGGDNIDEITENIDNYKKYIKKI